MPSVFIGGKFLNIFCIGDVVGEAGCGFLLGHLPAFKKLKGIDVCIANGENSAKGNGITQDSAKLLFSCGVDIITTGNHAFKRPESYETFDNTECLLRPANYGPGAPGKGYYIYEKGSMQLAVVNLMGTVFMENLENPFVCAEKVLKEISGVKNIIFDFHAEATAEKRAMGFFLDGKASAVFGTHTHVRTADAEILPEGTAYISDIGMTGVIDSVLGITPEIAIKKMKTMMPVRFDSASGKCKMEGCIFEICQKTGKAVSAEGVTVC